MSSNVSTRLMERRARFIANRYQRRRNVLLATLTVSAGCAAAWWIGTGPPLQVRHVAISGYTQPDQADIVRRITVGAAAGDAFHLPVQRLRAALADAPWVENIAVSHDWPNGLVVRVTEATPVAIAVTPVGERWLVSERGRVLSADPPGGKELPEMIYPAAIAGEWVKGVDRRGPLRIASALSADVRGAVRGLRVEDGVLIGRLATTNTELRFGQPIDLWRKGRALDAILASATTQKTLAKTAYIDLSNAQRPVFGGLPPDETQASTTTQGSALSGEQPSSSG